MVAVVTNVRRRGSSPGRRFSRMGYASGGNDRTTRKVIGAATDARRRLAEEGSPQIHISFRHHFLEVT